MDHEPLQWLASVKDHKPQILQWYLFLLPLKFTDLHWQGHLHHNADFLSHHHEDVYQAPEGRGMSGVPHVAAAAVG